MAEKALVVVDDLFFLAKIREAARQSGLELRVALPETAAEDLAQVQPRVVILDLNHRSGRAIQVLQAIKEDVRTRSVPVLGFLSHVQGDLAAQARDAGCDSVMARSAFSQRLPQILSSYVRL
jgi:CheY-like chemotaxis protein